MTLTLYPIIRTAPWTLAEANAALALVKRIAADLDRIHASMGELRGILPREVDAMLDADEPIRAIEEQGRAMHGRMCDTFDREDGLLAELADMGVSQMHGHYLFEPSIAERGDSRILPFRWAWPGVGKQIMLVAVKVCGVDALQIMTFAEVRAQYPRLSRSMGIPSRPVSV